MKFSLVYLVIGIQPTVYIIDHLTKVFMEKMLGGTLAPGTLAPMAHLKHKIKIKDKYDALEFSTARIELSMANTTDLLEQNPYVFQRFKATLCKQETDHADKEQRFQLDSK